MASDLGGWFRRILGKGSKNGNGENHSGSSDNGNGTSSIVSSDLRALAKRPSEREASAIVIQKGIRQLSDLLEGIEGRLEVQNEQGREVWSHLEALSDSMRSMPSHGEHSQAVLDSIRDEVERQGQLGEEVAGYFRSIPQILTSLEAGGSVRQTQLELARGLVREVVSQGHRLEAFQKGAAETAAAVRDISKVGAQQLICLKGVEREIRQGFESAGGMQTKASEEWQRIYRRTVIGGISILGAGILLIGAGIFLNLAVTRGVLDAVRPVTPAVVAPVVNQAPAESVRSAEGNSPLGVEPPPEAQAIESPETPIPVEETPPPEILPLEDLPIWTFWLP